MVYRVSHLLVNLVTIHHATPASAKAQIKSPDCAKIEKVAKNAIKLSHEMATKGWLFIETQGF